MWTNATLVDTARIILCCSRIRHLTFDWFFSALLERTAVDGNDDGLEADIDPNRRESGDLSGSWLEQVSHRSENALFMETFLLIIWGFWRAGWIDVDRNGTLQVGYFQR